MFVRKFFKIRVSALLFEWQSTLDIRADVVITKSRSIESITKIADNWITVSFMVY